MKRKLKRALALLTAALLACTMAPVALAAEGEETPLYEYLGYDSAQAFMDEQGTAFPETDYTWLENTFQGYVAQCEADPQIMADYSGYTLPTTAELYGVTEEELPLVFAWELTQNEYLNTFVYDWEEPAPPTLSVQLMGETVAFPDAQPETVQNRTMVPLRAMVEALHGETGYDGASSSVTAKVGDTTVRFALGGDRLYWNGPADKAPEGLHKDGAESYLTMDVKPYEKGGRTYVPVRFFAEAFGLTVKWDEWELTAVVYDKAALIDSVDSRFTVLNELLAAQPKQDPDQTLRTAATIAVTYTAFNTIDGNESFPMNGTLNMVAQGQNYEMDLELDLYTLVRMLLDQQEQYGDEELSKAVELLKGDLQNASFEMIFNADENTLYLRCPLLLKALGLMEPALLPKEGADTWVRFEDVFDESMFDMAELYGKATENGGSLTIGSLLVESAEASFGNWYASTVWSYVQDAADALALFAGDDKMIKNGDTYSISIDEKPEEGAKGLAGMLFDADIAYLQGSMTFNTRTGAAEGKLSVRQEAYWQNQLRTYEFSGDAQNATLKMSMHENNEGLLEMEMKITQKPSADSPAAQPPETDKVIDFDVWLGIPEEGPEAEPAMPEETKLAMPESVNDFLAVWMPS